ncbi:MAG: hypothetical protein JSV56_01690 [Methanomassiliicoccales archaeon]|nr:MAG: hypothetical protein JSV56_01690 [Methanomassiliicoccales archaeon]
MADKIRVTVKEKILIHLQNYTKLREEYEVPVQTSQEGMAQAVGVRRSHIASALKDLKAQELVEEQKARIKGHERRKNAYFLTFQGEAEATRLKQGVMEKSIKLRSEDGTLKEVKISDLREHIEERLTILEVLNGLTEDGILDLKVEKEEEKPERTVVCPYCGLMNANFDLNPVQLEGGVSGYFVSCMFCGYNFNCVESAPGEAEVPRVYQPFLQPPVWPPEQYYPPPPTPTRRENPRTIGLALFFLLGSFILLLGTSLGLLPETLCFVLPLGLIISVILIIAGLNGIRGLSPLSRRIMIVFGTVFISFIVYFMEYIIEVEYDSEHVLMMFLVLLPAFGFFIFGKPLAKDLRSELSLSLGVFLVLFGGLSLAFYSLFSTSPWLAPFWVIAGATMSLMSFEIERLDNTRIMRAVSVGVGAFVAIFCLVVLISYYSDLGILKCVIFVLWLFVGASLVIMRFVDEETCEKMLSALRSAMLLGLGVLFILVGFLLAVNGRYMECAIELFIGVPIIWYGLGNVKEFERSQLGQVIFIIASEIFSVFVFILF